MRFANTERLLSQWV